MITTFSTSASPTPPADACSVASEASPDAVARAVTGPTAGSARRERGTDRQVEDLQPAENEEVAGRPADAAAMPHAGEEDAIVVDASIIWVTGFWE
jgi:hypothetical protein